MKRTHFRVVVGGCRSPPPSREFHEGSVNTQDPLHTSRFVRKTAATKFVFGLRSLPSANDIGLSTPAEFARSSMFSARRTSRRTVPFRSGPHAFGPSSTPFLPETRDSVSRGRGRGDDDGHDEDTSRSSRNKRNPERRSDEPADRAGCRCTRSQTPAAFATAAAAVGDAFFLAFREKQKK